MWRERYSDHNVKFFMLLLIFLHTFSTTGTPILEGIAAKYILEEIVGFLYVYLFLILLNLQRSASWPRAKLPKCSSASVSLHSGIKQKVCIYVNRNCIEFAKMYAL